MDDKLFRSLSWRCIGPHRGGRVVAVAGHPTEPGTFYFGGCAGGVWKTTSGGALWEIVSDGYFTTSAVGAIAVAPSSPGIIYVGTGEATIRGNVSHGDGIYKSNDGGASWRNIGLADTRHIGAIVVHPTNPEIVYVAALGHAWGPNAERGVFRTRDGGASWQKVLFKSENAGAIDLSMDPNQPDIIYATVWQTRRYPHALVSGGEESGLWRSTDGGDTWGDISRAKGLPSSGIYGKLGVAASPAQSGRVWAIFEAADKDGKDAGGLYRSEDWGATWERVNDKMDLRKRPWYYMHIFADPRDPDTVWILNLRCWKSTDGGKSFVGVPTPHGDNHGLWIDPRDPNRMIEGNDGGACVTYDGGRTWSSILNQPTAQFYHVVADDQIPYNVYGSQQDNWAMRLPSIDFEGAITWKDYIEPGGGESGYIAIGRKPPYTVFGGGIGTGSGHGRLIAWNPDTGQKRNVTVWPEVHSASVAGVGASTLKYRFQWTFPVEVSPHGPDALYICSNHIHRSTDEGTTWEVISPDLTRNDPDRQGPSGGPITHDNSGAEIYCTIFAFRESPHEPGVFWVGSDDGLVHISRDGGASWQNITPSELPDWALVSIIEPSPHDPATAYLAATCYKLDDTAPYLFKTSDYGATWTKITGNLPDGALTRVIREDPNRRGLLYCGTETGLYISFDDGVNWQPFQCNLPVTPVHDVIVKDTDLVVATHGRSFWILDDITPLRQMADGSAPVTLYKPRDTTRYRFYEYTEAEGTPGYVDYLMAGPVTVAFRHDEDAFGAKTRRLLDGGKNPPDGVILHYALADKPEGAVTLTIHDATGNTVRTFTSAAEVGAKLPTEAGANRIIWDFRYEPPTALEDDKAEKQDPKEKAEARIALEALAARALPGEYEAQLTVGETTVTQRFAVLPDPRLTVTPEELRAQFDLKRKIRDEVDEVHHTINHIRRLRKQVASWEEHAKAGTGHESIVEAAGPLKEKFTALEGELIHPDADKPQPGPARIKEKLATLSEMMDESDDVPTQGTIEVFAALGKQADTVRRQLQELLDGDVAAFNKLVRTSHLPAVGD
ncbi:MAG TPA: hypothetical protein VGF38_21675 [Ktedonobacterales bacterium]|jgi:photosystem II stability/assembly factor-like uncharacterized protein